MTERRLISNLGILPYSKEPSTRTFNGLPLSKTCRMTGRNCAVSSASPPKPPSNSIDRAVPAASSPATWRGYCVRRRGAGYNIGDCSDFHSGSMPESRLLGQQRGPRQSSRNAPPPTNRKRHGETKRPFVPRTQTFGVSGCRRCVRRAPSRGSRALLEAGLTPENFFCVRK